MPLFGLALLFFFLSAAAAPASEVYFSPNGGARQRLVRAIEESRKTIDIAVYSFTAFELAEALYAAKARGVHIRLLAHFPQLEAKMRTSSRFTP